uniref:Uncharacterized protein n=1 Tax=Ciona savignyi TaxID=51511 RepID=H2ZKB8_CIOSA
MLPPMESKPVYSSAPVITKPPTSTKRKGTSDGKDKLKKEKKKAKGVAGEEIRVEATVEKPPEVVMPVMEHVQPVVPQIINQQVPFQTPSPYGAPPMSMYSR